VVKFLVIRFSAIGDIVLTTPVIRCLKQQVDDAEVHFLVKKQYMSVVENNPYIDKIHVFDYNFKELMPQLRDEFFDYIIDLQHNLRSSRIKNKLKVIDFSFNKLNVEKWLLVNFNWNRLPDIHIVDRYLATTKVFDVENDNKGLDYFIPAKDEVDFKDKSLKVDLSSVEPNKYLALVIGAKHNTKKMPVEKIISICKKINAPVFLLGGPEDADAGEQITKAVVGDNKIIINTCGKFNLNQSASLVKQAGCILTHDTGLMHIAAAFHKTIISVWGNTIPQFGMTPYLPNPDSEIMEVNGLKCRPCTKIGFRICPKKHFNCMNQIDEQKIVNKINSIFFK